MNKLPVLNNQSLKFRDGNNGGYARFMRFFKIPVASNQIIRITGQSTSQKFCVLLVAGKINVERYVNSFDSPLENALPFLNGLIG